MNKLKGHTYLSESAARANSKFSGGFKGIISAVEQCLSISKIYVRENFW